MPPHPLQFTPIELKSRVGILQAFNNKLPKAMPLRSELVDYEKWCKQVINFNRDKQIPSLKSNTYDDHQSTISMFMGYCYKHEGVKMQHLSLKLFTNQVLLINFMTFMVARASNDQHITSTISHCVRVINYLMEKDPIAKADKAKVRSVMGVGFVGVHVLVTTVMVDLCQMLGTIGLPMMPCFGVPSLGYRLPTLRRWAPTCTMWQPP